jgi:AcrR family transcriptional regulator
MTKSTSVRTKRVRRDASARASGSKRSDGGAWRKDPDGKRRRVLDEATRLFAERGYASVSTAEIARAAGIAEGSVFHYFGSKAGLLRAAAARYGTDFVSAMFDGVDPDDAADAIRRSVEQAFAFVASSTPGFGLLLLSQEPGPGDAAAQRGGEAPLAQQANRLAVTQAVAAILEQWQGRGALAPLDAPVVAELLFGLVEAALRACFTTGEPPERYRRATVDAITRILAIPAAAPR